MRIPFKRTLQMGISQSLNQTSNSRKESKNKKPLWAVQPTHLQLDRKKNRCTLNCEYCNPQNWMTKTEQQLPLTTVDHVCKYLKNKKIRLNFAYPWMNSDPLLDEQLTDVSSIIVKHLKCPIGISTNGVAYGRRHLLVNPNFYEVNFTISAPNPELYAQVHGKPLFNSALKTLYWLKQNKHWRQSIQVRYVLYPRNASEFTTWQNMFKEFKQDVRCLHYGDERKQSAALEGYSSLLEHYREIQKVRYAKYELPCNCFGNLNISTDGKIMQCCDLPDTMNYGHVEEVDILEAYQKRLERGLDVEGCKTCNQKNANWRELFEKYVW